MMLFIDDIKCYFYLVFTYLLMTTEDHTRRPVFSIKISFYIFNDLCGIQIKFIWLTASRVSLLIF